MSAKRPKRKKVKITQKEILEFLIDEQKTTGYKNRVEYDEMVYQGHIDPGSQKGEI
ncbi:MAG: hypothetical protein WC976_06030 [Caldisericia bacterium]